MNTSDKIKLTAEIASRLISAKPEISIKDCVELAKEITEESEKIYIHEYQSTQSTQSQKEYWDKWNPYTIT